MDYKIFSIRMFVPIILILLCSLINFGTPCQEQKERISKFLNTAMDMIAKVQEENISCPEENENNYTNCRPQDCTDLYQRGYNKSGVYEIWPANRLTSGKCSVHVYCDMDDGGWTVIQRRGDFGRAKDYFNQNWKTYKEGFGDLERDFWLGNDNIYAITSQRLYSVYFDLEDNKGNKSFAQYDNFWIDDEFNKYTLHIFGYRGTAGDSMTVHNTNKFSTPDRDNDSHPSANCAQIVKSGWWLHNCCQANLNGVYNTENSGWGIDWHAWKNWKRNRAKDYIRATEIKIKPSIF